MQKGSRYEIGQTLIFLLVGVSIITIAGYFIYTNSQNPIIPPQIPQYTPSPSPSNTNPILTGAGETTNWKTYTNSKQGFTIKYPNGAEIKVENDGNVLLTLSGPTQKSGADFYDGIFLRFNFNALIGKNIKQVADEELQKAKNTFDTYGDVIEDTKQFTLTGINGYTYTIANVGIHTFIYLPNNSGGYVVIINSTSDPTGKGFQNSANQILSTFRFD